MKKARRGEAIQWLKEHIAYAGDDCLAWPFARDPNVGRGRVGYNGRPQWAHRIMCELAHGPAPTSKHQAAHNCGKGHEGCINPRHLEWKTNAENCLDRRKHGTHLGAIGSRTKLAQSQIDEIQARRGESQWALARQFGVSLGCIRYWQNEDRKPALPGQSYAAIRRRSKRAA